MPDIYLDFSIRAPLERVFEAISTPAGLDAWWTKSCSGKPQLGEFYVLGFGPEFEWQAQVTNWQPSTQFELKITRADADWKGTRLGFLLESRGERTAVKFSHVGWRQLNDHFRISSFCWATYLRLLRRFLEHGEVVAYEQRDDA